LEASEKVQNLEKQYYSIVSEFQKNNIDLSNLIKNDYDKFLYSVANNEISLVNNQDIDVTLSSNLFEANTNYLRKVDSLINLYNIKNNKVKTENIDTEKVKSNSIILDDRKANNKVLLSQNGANSNA
jgi:hypothetical protein